MRVDHSDKLPIVLGALGALSLFWIPSAVSVPPSSGQANQVTTKGHAESVTKALVLYASDYDNVLPWPRDTRTAKMLISLYTGPGSDWRTKNPNGGTLEFNLSVGGIDLGKIPHLERLPSFYDSRAWPDGSRVVAFLEQHARAVSSSQWNAVRKLLRMKLGRAAREPLPPNYGDAFFKSMGLKGDLANLDFGKPTPGK